MIIVIDDERTFDGYGDVTYCRSSTEGLATLTQVWSAQWLRRGESIRELWLDHDLGKADTIWPVVDFLYLVSHTDKPLEIGWVYIHTMNPSGALGVLGVLEARYNATRVPLPTGA